MTETRAEKAQRLVDEGRVRITLSVPAYSLADVKGDHGTHKVSITSRVIYFCTCEWGLYHSYTDDLCAHALAVKLAVERRNKPC